MPRPGGQQRLFRPRPEVEDPEAIKVLQVLNEASNLLLAAVQGNIAAPPVHKFEELRQFIQYQVANSGNAQLVANRPCALAVVRLLSALVRWASPRTHGQRMTHMSAATVASHLVNVFCQLLLEGEAATAEPVCTALLRTGALPCLSLQLKQAAKPMRQQLELLTAAPDSASCSSNSSGVSATAATAAAVAASPETADASRTSMRWAAAALKLGAFMSTCASEADMPLFVGVIADSSVAEHAAVGILHRGLLVETLRDLCAADAAALAKLSGWEDDVYGQQQMMYRYHRFCQQALQRCSGGRNLEKDIPAWHPSLLGPCCQYLTLAHGLSVLAHMDGMGTYGLPERVARALPLLRVQELLQRTGRSGGSNSGGGDAGGALAGLERPFEALVALLLHHIGGKQQQQPGHTGSRGGGEGGPGAAFQLSPQAALRIAARVVRLAVRSGQAWASREEENRSRAARGSAGAGAGGAGDLRSGSADGEELLGWGDVTRVALQALLVYHCALAALQRTGGGGSGRGVEAAGGTEGPTGTAAGSAGVKEEGVQTGRLGRPWQEGISLSFEVLSHCMRFASLEQQDRMLGWLYGSIQRFVHGDGGSSCTLRCCTHEHVNGTRQYRILFAFLVIPVRFLQLSMFRFVPSPRHSAPLPHTLHLSLVVSLMHTPAGPLPASLSAQKHAVLSGGVLPCLECLLRRAGRSPGAPENRIMVEELLSNEDVLFDRTGLSWLLAYGDPLQAASFVASCGKVLRALGRDAAPAEETRAEAGGQGAGAPRTRGSTGNTSSSASSSRCGSVVQARLGCALAMAWHRTNEGGWKSLPCAGEVLGMMELWSGSLEGGGRRARSDACDAAAASSQKDGGGGALPPASPAAPYLDALATAPARQLQLVMSFATAELLPSIVPLAVAACRALPAVAPTNAANKPLVSAACMCPGLALSFALSAAWELAVHSRDAAALATAPERSGGGGGGGDDGSGSGSTDGGQSHGALAAAEVAAAAWRQVLLPPERPGVVQLVGALLPVLPLLASCPGTAYLLVRPAVGVCRVLLQVCPKEVRRLAVGVGGRGAGGDGGTEGYGGGWRPECFVTAATIARAAGHGGCAEVALRLAEVVAPWWGREGTEERARQAAAALGPVPCGASLLLPTPAEARAALPLPARRCAHASCTGLWGDSEAGLLGGAAGVRGVRGGVVLLPGVPGGGLEGGAQGGVRGAAAGGRAAVAAADES